MADAIKFDPVPVTGVETLRRPDPLAGLPPLPPLDPPAERPRPAAVAPEPAKPTTPSPAPANDGWVKTALGRLVSPRRMLVGVVGVASLAAGAGAVKFAVPRPAVAVNPATADEYDWEDFWTDVAPPPLPPAPSAVPPVGKVESPKLDPLTADGTLPSPSALPKLDLPKLDSIPITAAPVADPPPDTNPRRLVFEAVLGGGRTWVEMSPVVYPQPVDRVAEVPPTPATLAGPLPKLDLPDLSGGKPAPLASPVIKQTSAADPVPPAAAPTGLEVPKLDIDAPKLEPVKPDQLKLNPLKVDPPKVDLSKLEPPKAEPLKVEPIQLPDLSPTGPGSPATAVKPTPVKVEPLVPTLPTPKQTDPPLPLIPTDTKPAPLPDLPLKPTPTAAMEFPAVKPAPSAPAARSTANTRFDVDLVYPKPGDGYAAISRRLLGDDRYAAALEAHNRGKSVDALTARNEPVEVPPVAVLRRQYAAYLNRPAAEPITPVSRTEPRPTTLTGRKVYTVPTGGQTLKQIAAAAFGDQHLWGRVYDENRGLTPDQVVPAGTRVQLPRDSQVGD